MHLLSGFRARVVIFLLVLLILWQIFRTWPEGGEYHVSEYVDGASIAK